MSFYWIDGKNFYVGVETDEEGRIVKIAPLFKTFKGQRVENLFKWLKYKKLLKNGGIILS